MATARRSRARKRYWDYPSSTTVDDLIGPGPDQDTFAVTWDNKPMRGYRRDGLVLAYTTVGQPGTLVMFDWPDGDRGKVHPVFYRLDIQSQAQLDAMARSWYIAGTDLGR